ncbi:MAG: T9SS type A sorting domain-containing protein, partial [Desulfocucumaceae bacterium]
SLATGDLNNDDTTDLIVGDYWNMNGDGHINIYKGSASFDTLPWVVIKGHGGEELGLTLNSGGDVNGDSMDDLVVGAFCFGDGTNYPWCAGRVYVYRGGAEMDTIPYSWLSGEAAGHFLGEGNVDIINNISNYSNVIAGTAEWYETGHSGKIYILNGGITMDTIPDLTMVGRTDSTGLGYWSSAVGNMDTTKSYGDWISGAPGNGEFGGGTTYGWLGTSIMDSIPESWLAGETTFSNIGSLVDCAGDVNNDGKNEIIISNYAAPFGAKMVWVCKYSGPDGVAGRPGNNEQLTISNMFQNTPNPFSQQTAIKYQINSPGRVNLSIYNISGQLVRVLANEVKKAGSYEILWDSRDEHMKKVANGVYIYKLSTKSTDIVKKMTLIR